MHTAVKISPQYSGTVVYVLDASRSVPVVQSLLDARNQVAFSDDIKEQYAEMREVRYKPIRKSLRPERVSNLKCRM